MTDDQNAMTSGEVYRALNRIESSMNNMAAEMRGMTGPFSELKVNVRTAQEDIDGLGDRLSTLEDRLGAVRLQAAAIGGVVAAATWVVRVLLSK